RRRAEGFALGVSIKRHRLHASYPLPPSATSSGWKRRPVGCPAEDRSPRTPTRVVGARGDGVDRYHAASYEGCHPTLDRGQQMDTEHVAIVGAGQMGAGIAQVLLQSALQVTLIDVSKPMLDKAADRIRAGLLKLEEKGKLDDARRQAALSRLRTAAAVAEAKGVDFAIEAVSENEELKAKIFRELDGVVRPGGVLATNTSSIPITRIASSTRRPEAVIGM